MNREGVKGVCSVGGNCRGLAPYVGTGEAPDRRTFIYRK